MMIVLAVDIGALVLLVSMDIAFNCSIVWGLFGIASNLYREKITISVMGALIGGGVLGLLTLIAFLIRMQRFITYVRTWKPIYY